MGLSCDVECDDPSSFSFMWLHPEEFSKAPIGRRNRCRSCKKLIDVGDDCLAIQRYRVPVTDIEIRIYSEEGEISLAPHWLCEECGGLMMSLLQHGYALDYNDDMRELVKEHAALVRISGDAPCKKRLLRHDLDIVNEEMWASPKRVTFELVLAPLQPGWFERPLVSWHCILPSLAAFEAHWSMLQAAFRANDSRQWRISYRSTWNGDAAETELHERPTSLASESRR